MLRLSVLTALSLACVHAALAQVSTGLYKITNKGNQIPLGVSGDGTIVPANQASPATFFVRPGPMRNTFYINYQGNIVTETGDGHLTVNPGQGDGLWTVTQQRGLGSDDGSPGFSIVDETGLGWVYVDDGSGGEVQVRPLISTRSIPPFFPAQQLWRFDLAN